MYDFKTQLFFSTVQTTHQFLSHTEIKILKLCSSINISDQLLHRNTPQLQQKPHFQRVFVFEVILFSNIGKFV